MDEEKRKRSRSASSGTASANKITLPVKAASAAASSSSSTLGIALIISLVSMVVVGVLMRGASVNMFSEDTAGWRDTEFDAAASRFQTHVMLAHVEWIRLSEPRQVALEVRGDTFTEIPMGENGWPIGRNGERTGNAMCQDIWELLAEPGDMRRAMNTAWAQHRNQWFCEFYYDGSLRFRYQPSNGQIYHEPKPR
ncbi:hypothetical protein CWE13_06510 [Aliidiomarina shirensis]|uniref:Type II secretory pathway component n=1 Tax=Aliidiomarina shirensis TaxID=1048642 RepID=A0A432WV05_9GAMM|nr:hypothetical protein [Aliidiomarina shirensis]RUO37601.1 hypothetical protein CWE13_06510 [Aliidiomarina shirensis]